VHIQRVDYDYATVSFPSFRASLEYFADLCAYLGQPQGEVPPEMVAAFFADVAALAESDEALCETAHAIICAAAETVHDVLGGSKGEDAVETAVRVVDVIDRAVMGLIELTEEAGEDETDKMLRVRKMREQMTAKEKEAAKSYEILG
jgi:hypothetical protein